MTGLLLILFASIGNAEWWVILVNRRHSLRYKHQQLVRIRRLHDAGILCFPPFLLWIAGRGETGLLNGGSYFDQPLSVQGMIALTLVGLLPLVWSIIRWNLKRAPSRFSMISCESHNCLDESPPETVESVRGERRSLLTRLPWNEIYHLEVNQKRLRFPTPTKEGMLRIAHFSDIHLIGTPGHGFHDFVTEKLIELSPDLFLFTGDLLDRMNLLPDAERMFRRLAEIAPGYFVLGNHDWLLNEKSIREGITATGWTSIAGSTELIQCRGMSVMLAGSELPWMGSNPKVDDREDEIVRILLSHTPDQRDFAIQNDFDLMLSGHNHGGQVVLPLVGPVYSPSIYGVKYASGVFEQGKMLIHVSRGVGAKDLLRFNCKPEISLLELDFTGRDS